MRKRFYSIVCLFGSVLIALFLYLSTASVKPVYAQATGCDLNDPNWIVQTLECAVESFRRGTQGGNNSFAYGYSFFGNMNYIISDFIGGTVQGKVLASKDNYLHNTALGNISLAMVSMVDNKPADFGLWVADTGASLGFIPKQAYAQGLGFSGLSPLLPLWKGMRNIAYFLMAIVMIVIGFMVMFRKKIDPKTVVMVQNALPRIVITLLLITFSYAIVGLLIDLMYLLISFGIGVLGLGLPGLDVPKLQADYTTGGFWALFGAVFGPLNHLNPYSKVMDNIVSGQLLDALANVGKGWLLTVTGIGPLFTLLLGLAYLFSFVRIFFMLLSAYVHIILSVIVSPLQLLMDAFPGGTGFSSWIKNLLSNIMVFPITIFMLLLGNVLTQGSIAGKLWEAPLIPHADNPITGSTYTGDLMVSLIWLGIIIAIPTVAKGIKEALKVKPVIPAGAGALASPLTESFQSATGAMSLFYYGKGLLPQKKER